MKIALFLSFVLFISFPKCNAQTIIPVEPQFLNAGLTVYFQDTYDSTLAVQAQDVLENFNSEKITFSSYDHALKQFHIKHTPALNRIELLAIFRDIGMEAYLIENNEKYTLNGTSSGLDVNPTE